MAQCHVHVASEQVKKFGEKHGIQKLSLFGSVLGDDFGPNSVGTFLFRQIGLL